MPKNPCPSRDELSGYLQGTLPPPQAEAVTVHLAACPSCEDTIYGLESAPDPLIEQIKGIPSSQPFIDEPACHKVIESVKRRPPAVEGTVTPVASRPAPPTPASEPARVMNRTEFVEFLTTTGFVSTGELATVEKQLLPAEATDVQALARVLVQQGKLTKYQAAAIYQGKGKSLIYGEHVVLDRIGAGGMGQVFKARHRRMDRIVAIKVMSPAAMKNADSVKRFEREVRAAAKLAHPNIVHAYDAAVQDGQHFLVMEYVEGPDLSSLVKKQGKLPIKQACDYIAQAAKGFAFAHTQGIVHRDIKPGNLLVDKNGTVKVLDMGLARFDDGGVGGVMTEGELTQSGAVMGTVDYMAPEQALNTSRADAKSDVYGLGCTLYRLLTGESIFGGQTMVEKILAHRDQPIPSLRKVRPDAPPTLEGLLARMVAKRPEERPTMQEIAETLATMETASPGLSGLGMETFATGAAGVSPPAAATVPQAFTVAAPVPNASRPAPAAPVRKAAGAAPPKKRSNMPLLAAAGAGAVLIALGVWFIFRDDKGNETARVQLPDGGTVQTVVEAGPQKLIPPPVAAIPSAIGSTDASNVDPSKMFALPQSTGTPPPPTVVASVPPSPTSSVAPAPVVATPVSAGGWIDLLPLVDPAQDAVSGAPWAKQNGELSVVGSKASRIVLPVQPTANYDLEFEFTRQAGTQNVGFFFPAAGKETVYILAINGRYNGLLWMDGKRAAGLSATTNQEPIENGRRYKMAFEIRVSGDQAHLVGKLDGKVILNWRGLQSQLDTDANENVKLDSKDRWLMPVPLCLGLGVHESTAVFHYAKLRLYDGELKPVRPGVAIPASSPAVAAPIAAASSGNLYFYPQPFARNAPCAIFDALHYDGSTPLTVEGWVVTSPAKEVINHGKGSGSKRAEVRPFGIDRYAGGVAQLGLIWHVGALKDDADEWKLEAIQNVAGQKITGPLSTGEAILAPRNGLHHFAWVLSPKAADGKQDFTVWIDGKRIKYGTSDFTYDPADPFFSQGFLDELRVSKIARYSAEFTPAKRFEPDADTIALYHCDEGSGDMLVDSSGNGHNGKLINAAWSPVGSLPGTTAVAAVTPVTQPAPVSTSAVAAPLPPSGGPSPLDGLKRENIPQEALQLVGLIEQKSIPLELVAVLPGNRTGSPGPGRSVALSPDFRTLAIGGSKGPIYLVDVASGSQIGVLEEHAVETTALAFSPDGQTLASGSRDGSVVLWDWKNKKRKLASEKRYGVIRGLTFSHDGKTLASGCEAFRVSIWNVADLKETVCKGSKNYVHDVAFSPDDRSLVSASQDATVRLWEVATGQPIGEPLAGGFGSVFSVAFNPIGKTIAWGTADPVLKLRDIAENREIASSADMTGRIRSIAFDPAGRLLATASDEGMVMLRQASDGKLERSWQFPNKILTRIAFDPTGRYLAVVNNAGSVFFLRLSGATTSAVPLAVGTSPGTSPTRPFPPVGVTGPALTTTAAARQPLPATKDQQAAIALIKEVYKDDYLAARVPDKKSSFAVKLLQQATQAVDPVERYVLLSEARAQAVDGDEPQVLRQVLQAQIDGFEIDAPTTIVDGWKAMLAKSRPTPVVRTIYDDVAKRFEDAVVAADFDAAKKYADFATTTAPRLADAAISKAARDRQTALVARQQEYATAKSAVEKLTTLPDDAEANTVVGRYRALVEGDWPNALPLLAKGNEEPWKELATKSLAAAADGPSRAAVGDAWWDAAQAKATQKSELTAGALYWYQAALPSLNGLQKTRIEKRIADAAAVVPQRKIPPTMLAGLATPVAPTTSGDDKPFMPNRNFGDAKPTTPVPTSVPAAPTASNANATLADPVFQQWIKSVAAMPAQQQVDAVSKKLMELNPGFDGQLTPRIENGVVWHLKFQPKSVTNLSPLRVFGALRYLICYGPESTLDDLSPLKGMPLTDLYYSGLVTDLSPLRGMPLTHLSAENTPVSDLSPLRGMPLTFLSLNRTQISDLSPLHDCKQLTSLNIAKSKITPAMVDAFKKAVPNCKVTSGD